MTGTVTDNLSSDSCNRGTVVCDIVGSGGKTITRNNEDVCDVPTCEITLDREVDCGNGAGFEESCVGWNAFPGMSAEDVTVRYTVNNTGDDQVSNCVITKGNSGLPNPSTIAGPIATSSSDDTSVQAACSDSLDANEPAQASVLCDCDTLGGTASAMDSADFECETPGLSVTKSCGSQDAQLDNVFTITITNTTEAANGVLGSTNFIDCVITDELDTDAPCPSDGDGMDISDTLIPDDEIATLMPGVANQVQVTGTVNSLTQSACNDVSVTCTVDTGSVTGKSITSTADDTCAVGGGCFTRTDGYWGLHPNKTALFATGINNCGFDVANETEAIREMCVNNSNANAQGISRQRVQLQRQCMAAQINLLATAATPEGDSTSCDPEFEGVDGGITARIMNCCAGCDSLCAVGDDAEVSSCLGDVSAFNEEDFCVEFDLITGECLVSNELDPPFDEMPADSTVCRNTKNEVNNHSCNGAIVAEDPSESNAKAPRGRSRSTQSIGTNPNKGPGNKNKGGNSSDSPGHNKI